MALTELTPQGEVLLLVAFLQQWTRSLGPAAPGGLRFSPAVPVGYFTIALCALCKDFGGNLLPAVVDGTRCFC